MKKIIFILLLMFSVAAYADDTSTLQTQINGSNTTLPAGHPHYSVTGLTLYHSLNLNGDTIFVTATTGTGFIMSSAGVKLSNGTIIGPTDVYSGSGITGVYSTANNDTVTNCSISKFPNFGINATANSFIITNNSVSDMGYIAFFFLSTGNSIGGKCINNIFDRSMLSASTILQPAVAVRCASGYHSQKWTITNNVYKMPIKPTDGAAACMEIRYCNNSIVSQNICQGGVIGISIVGSDSTKTTLSTFTGQSSEAIEYAASYGNICNNTISNQLSAGIQIDGGTAHLDTIGYNNISGCMGSPILISTSISNIFIVGCNISFTSGIHNQDAITLNGATQVSICLCNFYGNGTGRYVVQLINSNGGVYMASSTITDFTTSVIRVYANGAYVVNNILMQNVTVKNTPLGLSSLLQGGATLGSNIQVN